MALRTLCWNGSLGLMLTVSGCGSATVDAGSLSNGGSGGTEANMLPDAGNVPVSGAKPCTPPDLARCRLVFDSDGGKLERRIYWMRADGTEVEALTPPEEFAREPAMSPDGSKLAYVTSQGIKLLDMASRQSELLVADGDQPAWSADGSTLAYRMFGSIVEVRNMSDGSIQTTKTGESANPELLPDGTTVLIEGDRSGPSILTVDVSDGFSGEVVVPRSSVLVTHPTLSPDGAWVAIAMLCPGSDRWSLWTNPYAFPTPACEGRRITPPSAPNATNPKWGPGVMIAYERGEQPRDIALIAADTGEEIVLAGPGDDRNPSWAIETFTPPK
jgi:Tol biopolymer transport system component